ncbi:MAG TPA: tRNA 2-thiouridine(34) synthase MnmA, partial [Chromatiales bacterium]|nr:tRNA 2-thiouridine(34) synthase MnmA [Chromatiales bacterium]
RTPNPDVLCNRHIKFGVFLEHARRLGATQIATGHYVRTDGRDPARLLRGADPGKDQSYFLHAVDGHALARACFPVGELTKQQVRDIATDAGLPVHAKRDSTGICFIGERPFREFLSRYLTGSEGPIQTPDGRTVGRHEGLMYYTIGQRQGLQIGGRADAGDQPWYVLGKDLSRNCLLVVQGREHPGLWSDSVVAGQPLWIAGEPAALRTGGVLSCTAKTRYRQPDAACEVRLAGDGLAIDFDQPQWAVAPGQYIVFYDGDECLGGAVIESVRAVTAAAQEQQ